MSRRERAKETIFGSSALVIVVDAMVNSFELLFAISDVAFPALALLSGTLAQHFDWLDIEVLTRLLVFFAVLYLLSLLFKLWERIKYETNNDN